MADFATPEDVEAAWRPLSAVESTAAAFWLPVASAYIRSQFPIIDDRIAAGTLDPLLAQAVTVSLVRRVIQNPDGLKAFNEQLEDYQGGGTFNDAAAAGELELTAVERSLLGASNSKAFSIAPGGRR